MSQSKVDKRKYEKKNRAAIMKREKRKKILGWCIFGVLVGSYTGCKDIQSDSKVCRS